MKNRGGPKVPNEEQKTIYGAGSSINAQADYRKHGVPGISGNNTK